MSADGGDYFVIASIDGSYRLLELSLVREIVPAMTLYRPRNATGACCGFANLRGETVPVYDLAQRGALDDTSKLIVIMRAGMGTSVGVLVDDVVDVSQFRHEELKLHPIGGGQVAQVVQREGVPMAVLHPQEVLDAA